MEPTTPNSAPVKKSNKKVGIALGVIIILAAIFITFAGNKNQPAVTTDQTPVDTSGNSASSETTNPAALPPSNTQSSVYKDGTYTAIGSYLSPGGPDKISVTLTLKNDIVTDVTATAMPGDRESAQYQNKFLSGYKAQVVGQNIATLHLTKVSGSSLTPKGFNDAVAQIQVQAKA